MEIPENEFFFVPKAIYPKCYQNQSINHTLGYFTNTKIC